MRPDIALVKPDEEKHQNHALHGGCRDQKEGNAAGVAGRGAPQYEKEEDKFWYVYSVTNPDQYLLSGHGHLPKTEEGT